jgi:hypothetical protein
MAFAQSVLLREVRHRLRRGGVLYVFQSDGPGDLACWRSYMLGYGFRVGSARLRVRVTGGLCVLRGDNAAGEVLLFVDMGLREPVVVDRRC